MTESVGYQNDRCEVKLPGCEKTGAGYERRLKYATVGPWLPACQHCACTPYEQPEQFKKQKEDTSEGF